MARRRYRNRRSYRSRGSSGGELLITFLVFIGIIFYQIYLNPAFPENYTYDSLKPHK